jgi:hypothetical protein
MHEMPPNKNFCVVLSAIVVTQRLVPTIMALILSNEEQLVAVVVLDRNKQIDKEIQLA